MKIDSEVTLLERLYKHYEDKTEYLYHEVGRVHTKEYISEDVLTDEINKIFNPYPTMVAISSEIPKPGDYLVIDLLGNSYILARQNDLSVKGFNNVCRHRGAKLLEGKNGNKQAFVCPYHRWQYKLSGELQAIPKENGFDSLKQCDLGLKAITIEEYKGIIFAYLGTRAIELKNLMAPLKDEFDDFSLSQYKIFHSELFETHSNWKQSIEQFLEIYHLKSVHRDSISKFFLEGVQVADSFDPHIRFSFARKQLLEIKETPKEQWRIKNFANIIYYIFPNTILLFQQDHCIFATFWPKGPHNTIAFYKLLVTNDTPKEQFAHFDLNDKLMRLTIGEDISVGKTVQQGYLSKANEFVHFGKYEASLTLFHKAINKALRGL